MMVAALSPSPVADRVVRPTPTVASAAAGAARRSAAVAVAAVAAAAAASAAGACYGGRSRNDHGVGGRSNGRSVQQVVVL